MFLGFSVTYTISDALFHLSLCCFRKISFTFWFVSVVFYSAITAMFYLSSMVSSVVISRIVDSNRNTRKMMVVCSLVTVVGDLVYMLHFSPYFLLVGKMLAGMYSFCLWQNLDEPGKISTIPEYNNDFRN